MQKSLLETQEGKSDTTRENAKDRALPSLTDHPQTVGDSTELHHTCVRMVECIQCHQSPTECGVPPATNAPLGE